MSFLDEASKVYYEGNPIIADSLFDSMAEKSGYAKVGYNGVVEDKHLYRLYSLNKIYDIKDVPFTGGYIDTPKLDGLAVSLLYAHGKLHTALTRGDGVSGKVITDKLAFLVPKEIEPQGVIFITGEVVALKSIENSRNYASGACNLKDVKEFETRISNLKFIAYSISIHSETYLESLKYLSSLSFETVVDRDWVEYPQDGRVLRVNSTLIYNNLGFTDKFPRGAIALKSREEEEIKETILREVIWQLGGSKVSPVAIFDEVILGDAKVTRATLHNAGFVEDLELQIGDTLLVRRSGQIIPQIVGKIWE